MKKSIIAVISLYLLSTEIALGCECTNPSYKFMDGISGYPFVAMVEVIRKDTARGYPMVNSKSFNHSHDYAFTVVKIIKQYSGSHSGDEIKIIDSKGFECFSSLFYKNIGDKFMVKGFIHDINEHVFRFWDKPLPKEDILVFPLCDTSQLQFGNNYVTGWITIKGNYRSIRRRNTILKIISFGLINRKKKGKEFVPQQMRIEKFERILKYWLKK